MSKDQVSGSLTLSLGGLADDVATSVAPMFAELNEAIRNLRVPHQHLSLDESVVLLVGQVVPVAYGPQVAKAIAGRLWDMGYRIVQVGAEPVAGKLAEQPDQESAVAWFEKEAGL